MRNKARSTSDHHDEERERERERERGTNLSTGARGRPLHGSPGAPPGGANLRTKTRMLRKGESFVEMQDENDCKMET